jgi:hypothetical protein
MTLTPFETVDNGAAAAPPRRSHETDQKSGIERR